MSNGDIVLNTENHGVMFFNKSKLVDEYQQLSLTDLETIIDQRDAGYSATCVRANHEGHLIIMSESENEKSLSFTKWDSSKNYEEVGSENQKDRPHPIMKINIHEDGSWV